jgi:uncharacterized protein (TIGR03067 family)
MEFVGDCLPPTTVITHVRRSDGALVVRGTAADDAGVRHVTVNGKEARPLTANFAEWEVALDPPAAGRLTARAVDRAGNEEPRPHRVVFGGGVLQTLQIPPESPKHEELPVATRPGGDPEGLNGLWRVEWQRRAGRATDRLRGMTWKIDGETISISTGGANADPRQRGGPRIPFRLDPASAGHIDLRGKVSVNPGIYRLEGDTLTICLGSSHVSPDYDPTAKPDGQTRPTEFSPEAGTVIMLKRVAP